MGWTLAEDWLTVAGLLLLTLGTGAQALANLAEFKSLQASVTKVASDAIDETLGAAFEFVDLSNLPYAFALVRIAVYLYRLYRAMLARRSVLNAVILMPRKLAQLRAKGGDEAVELARFMRLAQVWGIIMIGSALGLAAAVIQLVLAYQ